MPVLNQHMKQVVEQVRLGFVATVCPDGTPNVSPKGTLCVLDDEHLIFADIRSPGTVANLRANQNIEINVVDPFRRKGYRFKGRAVVPRDVFVACAEGRLRFPDDRDLLVQRVIVVGDKGGRPARDLFRRRQ